MTKWFAYIVLLLIFAPYLSSAVTKPERHGQNIDHGLRAFMYTGHLTDTIIIKKDDDKNKIKEISKTKRQAKPEKLDDDDAAKRKAKREQRPAGMERPPEIPRRNNN